MEKQSIISIWKNYWKKIFDYKSEASVKEYVTILITNLIIGILFAVFIVVAYISSMTLFVVVAAILFLYLLVGMLPFISLTVRRLKTVGRSGWWTLLLLIVGIGTLAVMTLCMFETTTHYSFDPMQNYQEEVYGPPEWEDTTELEETSEVKETTEKKSEKSTTEKENDLTSEENTRVQAASKAQATEEATETVESTEATTQKPEEEKTEQETEELIFDPGVNMEPCIYGPPEMFE